mmetsp:Transcript_5965/g.13136  ORF Transcript_5965/g.13136 Transcript_5965/m.13136 type:complete len:525 (+) Transcript_5965:134-1708(+)
MGCGVGKVDNFHEAYVLGNKIWQGEMGQVRTAKKPYEADDLSVRILDLRKKGASSGSDAVDPKLRKRANHEAQVWSKAGQHDHIVKLLDVIWETPMLYMVTEYCDYSLLYILERMPLVNEQTLSRFFRDALLALQHLHKRGIVHCDVRVDNFLVCGKKFTFKLTGFGAAQLLPTEGTQGTAYLYTPSGHASYMSPEMLSGKGYEYKTDVWSLGVIVYLLFYGQYPYKPKEKTATSMKDAILKGEPPPTFEPWMATQRTAIFSNAAMAFLKALLDRNVEERPTAEECMEFTYLKLVDQHEGREAALKQKLLPMLCGALRSGAFEVLTSVDEETDVDILLNYQQFPYHGPISPWTPLRPHCSILKSAMEATQDKSSTWQEEPDAIQALRKMRQGEVAQQLGTVLRGPNKESAMEGEFSISLGELKKMRKGDVFDELHKIMPRKSQDMSGMSGSVPTAAAAREAKKRSDALEKETASDGLACTESSQELHKVHEVKASAQRRQQEQEQGVQQELALADSSLGPVTVL